MKKNKQHAVRKQPAYMAIIETLAKRIKSGAVPVGAVLSEGAIATLFDISRAPVRQAFGHLEAQGLVHRFDGRGVLAGRRKTAPLRIGITHDMLGLDATPVDMARNDSRRSDTWRNNSWDRLYYSLERDLIHRSVFGRFRVNELALARHFGVGRTVARNLLLRAQSAGILEKGDRTHWYVVPLDEVRVNDIYELRKTLEPLLIRSATIPRDLLDAMEARLRSVIAMFPNSDVADLDELENDIHVRCLGFGDNREMIEALKRTHCSLVIGKHIQAAVLTHPTIDSFMDEHLAIIAALQRRNGAAAAKALSRHLDIACKKAAERYEAFRSMNAMATVPYIIDGVGVAK